MKWNLEKEPKVGDTRDVLKFAWIPTIVEDSYKNRFVIWFEYYYAHQKRMTSCEMVDIYCIEGDPYWSTIKRLIIHER